MTQEDKELLLNDLCARLSYGVKILHTGWDCDGDTDFDTIETLIGIDDKFIYTVWDKTGDREKHCLSVSNWKPYLRPMSSMTEEEKIEYMNIDNRSYSCPMAYAHIPASDRIDWLNVNHFDYRDLIPKGLAIAVTKENNPYEN